MAKRILRSNFFRGTASLTTGSVIAIGLTLISTPILSRLYSPIAYGELAAFIGVTSVLAGLGTWQYQQALIVDTDETNIPHIIFLCLTASAVSAIISIPFVLIYSFTFDEFAKNSLQWLYLIPLLVMSSGTKSTLEALANRRNYFRLIAKNRVITTAVTILFSLFYALSIGGDSRGLVLSYCIGIIISPLLISYPLKSVRFKIRDISISRAFAAGKKHYRFPLYTFPGEFLSNLCLQMPVYALAAGGHTALLGYFSRARQLLTLPFNTIGGSVGTVYMRQAAIDFSKNGSCRPLFIKTGLALGSISIIPITIISIFSPSIFSFVLGEEWRGTGRIAQILAPMLYLRLIVSPLSRTLHVSGQQKVDFLITILAFVLVSLCVWLPSFLPFEGESIVFGFVIAYTIVYIISGLVSFKKTLALPADQKERI